MLAASHTLYDGKVGHIIASLFDHGTVSVAFPGTHRCFSTTLSTCSGTTTACGNGSEKFRITDVAHDNNSYFQIFNEMLFLKRRSQRTELITGSNQAFIHFQQHGMGSRTQADAFVSNACSTSASNGYLPKFEGGSANELADFMTEQMEEYKSQHGYDPTYSYKALRIA